MRRLLFLALAFTLAACESARLPVTAGTGPSPELPPPNPTLIPTVHVAKATGWPQGRTPVATDGMHVNAFATGLDHPRWLHVLPNGDVLVAETNAPPTKPAPGIKAWFMRYFMKKAGSAVPSANRITLLRDADGDGVAETKSVFLADLNSPFGMALVGDALYVANTDALLRYRYANGSASGGEKIVDLPAGDINYHWTKTVIASADGSRLYVTVGSNSNIGEKGMENEVNRAAILEVDPAARTSRVYASGLRNPVGLAWSGSTLFTVVNERDELGSDLVPDYLTSIRDGAFYGWPYSYYGAHVDARVKPQRPELVATAIDPDYAIGPHTGSLGLAITDRGAYIGQHGSWNRRPRSGYKVIFVPFENGRPAGSPRYVLTGFLSENGEAYGRPVGVAFARDGAMLVADDVGNAVWRVK